MLSVALALAAAIAAWSWSYCHRAPSTIVDFLDVGQGDAERVRSGDQEILIDGGPDRTVLAALGRAMPFFDRTIEYVVLTHPHADHFIGLIEVLDRYSVRTVVLPATSDQSAGYEYFLQAVSQSGAAVTVARCGDTLALGLARLQVMAPCLAQPSSADPTDANQASAVLRLEAFGRRALFMADAQLGEVTDLLASDADLSADALKVGHHGSRFATTAELLRRVRPTEAVIEVGRNYFGHPAPVVLERLRQAGVRVWRTDRDDAIRLVIDQLGRLTVSTRTWPWP